MPGAIERRRVCEHVSILVLVLCGLGAGETGTKYSRQLGRHMVVAEDTTWRRPPLVRKTSRRRLGGVGRFRPSPIELDTLAPCRLFRGVARSRHARGRCPGPRRDHSWRPPYSFLTLHPRTAACRVPSYVSFVLQYLSDQITRCRHCTRGTTLQHSPVSPRVDAQANESPHKHPW